MKKQTRMKTVKAWAVVECDGKLEPAPETSLLLIFSKPTAAKRSIDGIGHYRIARVEIREISK